MGKSSQYLALVISACLLVTLFAEGIPNRLPSADSENDEKAVSNVRVKRFFKPLCWVIRAVICFIWCKRGRRCSPVDNDDPYFTFCPSNIYRTIPKGKRSVFVTWKTPTAEDKTSKVSSIDQTYGGRRRGSYFYRHEVIKYVATDQFSNSAECRFTVYITLKTCPKPIYLQNGNVRCPTTFFWKNTVIWGDSCIWSCNEGYELRDQSTATQECEQYTQFSNGGTAECTAKRCADITQTLGNNMYMDFCSNGDKYESVCYIKCLDGYGPRDKTRVLRCGSDNKWTGTLYPCEDLPDKVPPYFEFCPDDIKKTIPEGETSVKVSWADPVAKDSDSGIDRVEQTNGPGSNSLFEETTQITYRAYDKETNFATCSFQVEVKLITCRRPIKPNHGDVSCPTRSSGWIIWGDVCTWSCATGAKMSGTAQQTCTKSEQFSDGGNVICTLITCPVPIRPRNGDVRCQTGLFGLVTWGNMCTWTCETSFESSGTTSQTCMDNGLFSDGGSVSCSKIECPDINDIIPAHMILGSCSDGNYFNSKCILECEGGYGPSKPTRTATCNSQKTWDGPYQDCRDIEPPRFDVCPPNIIEVYTERGETYGIATWPVPTATDRQGSVDVRRTLGRASGSHFNTTPTNIHRIVYSAIDEEANEAEQCVFMVQVIDRTCEPYVDDGKMTVSCDGYTWGSACNLTCDRGYPLNGSSTIYCEETADKSLDWNVDPYRPFCTTLPCPDLIPPEHGAISCTNWAHGRYCIILCNTDYALPIRENYHWTCDDITGVWPQQKPPRRCTSREPPYVMDQDNVFFYFSGDCTSASIQAQIREKTIQKLIISEYKLICTLSDKCSIDNVDVTCHPIARKKKNIRIGRSLFTHTVRIDFKFKMNIMYPVNFTSKSADDLLYALEDKFFEMSDLLQQDLSKGKMDLNITGLDIEVDPDSYTYGWPKFECAYGMKPNYATFTCAMCEEGTMYNGDTDDCEDCPVGTYQDEDGQLLCKQCPELTSTVTTGSIQLNQCKPKCDVGHYSLTGLANCAFCPIGTYQDEIGSTYCKMCPSDTNTVSPGSFDVSLCLNNDEIDTWNLCNRSACNGGICLFNSDGTTHCVCHDGFTGDACEIPPDPCDDIICENGGRCIPMDSNHTCDCPLGYTGRFCEELAHNGNFTEWTVWSDCSVTCGSGNISRLRDCINPAPGPNGLPCLGESQEIAICQQEECRYCEQIEFPDSYMHECSIAEDGENVCDIWCKDGYSDVRNRFRKIRCGPQTDYVWSFRVGNPNRNLPACAKSLLPTSLSVKSKLVNSSIPCDADVSLNGLQSFVQDKSNCSEMENCQTSVFTECSEAETKRNIRSIRSLTTVIEIVGTLPNIDYFPNGVYDGDIATRAAESWTALASDMTSLVESLTDATVSGELVVIADGIEYGVTHEYVPDQKCAQGKVPLEGICVTCPVGMYSTAQQCELCAMGYYQDREGQASCNQCPPGYTTLAEGAVMASQCNESGDINVTTSTPASVENSDAEDDPDSPHNEIPHDNNDEHDNNDKIPSDDNEHQSDNEDHTGKNDNHVGIKTTLHPDIEKVNIKQTPGYMYPTIGAVIGVLCIVIVIVSVTIVCKKKHKPRKDIDNSTKYGATIEPEDQVDITEKANGFTPATTTLPDRYLKYPVCINPAFYEEKGETNFKGGDSLDTQDKKCTIADNNEEVIIAKDGLKEVVPYSDRPLTATSVVMNSRPATAGSIALGLGSRQGSVASLGGLTDACNPCPKIE